MNNSQPQLFIERTNNRSAKRWSQQERSLLGSYERSPHDSALLRDANLAEAWWQLEAGARAPLLIEQEVNWLSRVKKPPGPELRRLFLGCRDGLRPWAARLAQRFKRLALLNQNLEPEVRLQAGFPAWISRQQKSHPKRVAFSSQPMALFFRRERHGLS